MDLFDTLRMQATACRVANAQGVAGGKDRAAVRPDGKIMITKHGEWMTIYIQCISHYQLKMDDKIWMINSNAFKLIIFSAPI